MLMVLEQAYVNFRFWLKLIVEKLQWHMNNRDSSQHDVAFELLET